jgi:hypothetical protein
VVCRVTIGNAIRRIAAGRHGRLRIAVRLGPGNRAQQYTPEAQAAGTQVFRATVRIGS